MIAPLLAAAFVLFAAAAGTGDYRLTAPGHEDACAKSLATCRAAQNAIRNGWLIDVERDTPTRCEPAPGCFDARSLCIQSYNCDGRRQ